MTSIADQYRIITTAACWIDRSTRGRIRFAGSDARSFLQGLLTNDLSGLAAHQGVYSAYLTPQGRMLADITVLDRGDSLLGLVAAGTGASLTTRFDLLIFAEDVAVTDVSSQSCEIDVTGGQAAALVALATGASAAELAALPDLGVVNIAGGFVLREGVSPFPAYRIVVETASREQIVAALDAGGATLMTEDLATALRIEAGRGAWGHDLGDDVIPLEAGLLERAISTSKGCYVGQEIVIRILHRGGGRVAKRLVTLSFDNSVTEAPAAKAALIVDGVAAGHLTSVAFSPAQGRFVGLGYLRREAAEIGRQTVVGDSGAAALVTGFAQ